MRKLRDWILSCVLRQTPASSAVGKLSIFAPCTAPAAKPASHEGRIKLESIEAGRGLAAIAVVLYHASRHVNAAYGAPLLASTFQFGHAGVDFFFVISGFIILFVHYGDVGQPARLNHYLERRFTRVLPTYWVALGLTVLLSLAGGHALPRFVDAVWSVFLLPSHREPILGIAWTLQYEIAFYAVFAVLIANRFVGLAIMAAWFLAVAAILAVLGWTPSFIPQSLCGAFSLEVFLGMAAAWWLRNRRVPNHVLLMTIRILSFALVAFAPKDVRAIEGYANSARVAYGIA